MTEKKTNGYPVEVFVAGNELDARLLRAQILGSDTPHNPKFEVLCWPGQELKLMGLRARSIFVDPNMSVDLYPALSVGLGQIAGLAPEHFDPRGWWR